MTSRDERDGLRARSNGGLLARQAGESMVERRWKRRILAGAVFMLLAVRGGSAAPIDSLYGGPFEGNWNNAANWSPNVVPNNGADAFDVDLDGGTVKLDIDATISSLNTESFGSVQALDHSLTVLGTTFLGSGSFSQDVSAGSKVTSLGALADFGGTTLSSGGLIVAARAGATSTVRFNGANIVTNAGLIELDGPGTFRLTDENGMDALRNFAANDFGGGFAVADANYTLTNSFTNNGNVEARGAATLTFEGGLQNYSAATRKLDGGSYSVVEFAPGDGTTIRIPNADIATLNARVYLRGTGATITDLNGNNALRNVTATGPDANFIVEERSLTLPSGFVNAGGVAAGANATITFAGSLANEGTLEAFTDTADASTIVVTGPLQGYEAATNRLVGGSYRARTFDGPAVLRLANVNVVSLATAVVLEGANARIEDQNGLEILRNLTTIESGGYLRITAHDFTAAGNLTNDGAIEINDRGNVTVPGVYSGTGAVLNFTSDTDTNFNVTGSVGTYNAGTGQLSSNFSVGSDGAGMATVRLAGVNVTRLDGQIELHGVNAQIVDAQGNDALRNLATITANGGLSVDRQRAFTTLGSLQNDGELTAGPLGVITVTGNLTNGGEVRVLGGSLTVTGALTDQNGSTGELKGNYLIDSAMSPATFRYQDANIRSISGIVQLSGSVVMILDQNGNNGLRNLSAVNSGGVLALSEGYNLTTAGEFTNSGDISATTGAELHVSGKLRNHGALTTHGAVLTVGAGESLINDGFLNASGTLTGNLGLLGTSDFFFSLAGTLPELEFDTLNVTGSSTLAGQLSISLQAGFTPLSTDSFDILVSSTLTGSFSNVADGARLFTEDGEGSFLVSYGTGAATGLVRLSDFQEVPEPGSAGLLLLGAGVCLGRPSRKRGGEVTGG